MKEIPVYLFTGFLESGKTSFIQDILRDPDFTEEEHSLLIVCEEGMEEYDPALLAAARTTLIPVEEPSALTLRFFRDLGEKYNPDRVLIELNGMWEISGFLEGKLPPEWPIYQIVATVNAQTFELYSNNLGPRMFEQLTMADLIVFNRCTDALKDMLYKKNIRAMNPRATIFLDDVNGGSEDYRDNMPQPFDLDAPVIEIKDTDFGLWYVDATSSPEKYEGKTVKFKAMAYKPVELAREHLFVPGRFAMVCCADDVQFIGFLCKGANTEQVKNRGWLTITAKVGVEYVPQYRGDGPVLYCEHLEPAQPAEQEIVYFN
ncbi:MAG: GTPase [Butyricicoccus pullicaecorum]|nr:GTPase [Butyricicoccus pullicaecorum]